MKVKYSSSPRRRTDQRRIGGPISIMSRSNLGKLIFCGWIAQTTLIASLSAQPHGSEPPVAGVTPLQFTKRLVASESFESVAVFDVNGDKQPDLISGAFWYEGPGFLQRHTIGHVKRYGEYYDDFSTIPVDINGDNRTDFVTGGWFGAFIQWRENPGKEEEWKEHLIAETGNVETTRAWDVDGDGFAEIVPNNPNQPLAFYRLERDAQQKPSGKFTKFPVADKQGHGLGFGDVNGDGRGDFIISNGWLEAPPNPLQGKWVLHEAFQLGTASIPILVVDVNSDGRNDLIVGQAHGYGLDWYEQKVTKDRSGPKTAWLKHPIDPYNAQFHTMEWTDLDGDGKNELITGKRYRAHNDGDAGAHDAAGIYYYKWNGEAFTKQVIAYGPVGEGKGTGIYFSVTDLRGTGRKDIVVAGKDGLYIFYNEGYLK